MSDLAEGSAQNPASDQGNSPGSELPEQQVPPNGWLQWLVRWGWRLGLVVALAWIIGYLPLQFFGEKGVRHYRRLHREVTALKDRNRRLADEVRKMRLEVRRLRDDDLALERAAREDLGMVRKGELIFVVEE